MFIEVAVSVPGLPPLTYHCENDLAIDCGMRVVVPVGRQVVAGIVTNTHVAAPEKVKARSIIKQVDEVVMLPAGLIKLGKWMAGYYRCSLGEALHAMLPGTVKPGIKELYHLIDSKNYIRRRGAAAVIIARLVSGPKEKKLLIKDLPSSAKSHLKKLEEEGVIRRDIELVKSRKAAVSKTVNADLEKPKKLSYHQEKALQPVKEALDAKMFKGFLLYGVTGSGKTEVYLQAMEITLNEGGGAILLLPEIALTTQIQERLQARFGSQVAVLHSGLTPKKRLEAWNRLLSGEANIAVGARSAVFAPVKNCRLIVVDEEYESSYKQEDAPRYHARDTAAMRAKQEQAVLLLGAATPSLETFYHARSEKLVLLTLPERIDQKSLPVIKLADMSQEFGQADRYPVFSSLLIDELVLRLENKEQVILFLNRRGFAPLVMCPGCKHILMCHDCSTSLVYHMSDDKLQCHSCGRSYPARPACPKCGTACVKLAGSGTQRIEEELRRLFPACRVARLDQDQTRKKGVLEKTLKSFKDKEIDVLVGTQMVAKGIDFQDVTLVGIISADTALHLPDFRAEERTFQLIVQVAGRAGRGGKPGLVIAQTQHIDHDVLALAAKHDYAGFYEREIAVREQLGYPPFKKLVNIVCRSTNPSAAMEVAGYIAQEAVKAGSNQDRILGPVPSPYQRVAKESRYQVLIKSSSHQSRNNCLNHIQQLTIRGDVKVIIDVDPASLL